MVRALWLGNCCQKCTTFVWESFWSLMERLSCCSLASTSSGVLDISTNQQHQNKTMNIPMSRPPFKTTLVVSWELILTKYTPWFPTCRFQVRRLSLFATLHNLSEFERYHCDVTVSDGQPESRETTLGSGAVRRLVLFKALCFHFPL